MRVWTFRGNVAGLHHQSVCASACVPNVDRRKLTASAIQCSVQSGLWKGPKQQGCFCYSCGWRPDSVSLFLKATTCAVLCLLSPHSTRGLVVETRTLGDTDSRLHCEIFFLCSFLFFFFPGLVFVFLFLVLIILYIFFFIFFANLLLHRHHENCFVQSNVCNSLFCSAEHSSLSHMLHRWFFFMIIIFLHHYPSSPSGWQCRVQSLNESLEGAIFILSCWEDNMRYIYIHTHIIYYQCSMIRVVVFECSFRIGQSSNQPVVAFTKDLWLWCRKCLALHDQWISKRQQAKHNSVICLYGWAFTHPQTPLPRCVNIRCWCQFEPGLSANHDILLPLSLPP